MFKFNNGACGNVFFTAQCTVRKEARSLDYVPALQTEIANTAAVEAAGFKPMPRVYNSSLQAENTFIELEFIPGKRLEDVSITDDVIDKLAKTLANLHSTGWIHGDLHQSNVMIDVWGNVRFIDFAHAELNEGCERYGDVYAVTASFTAKQTDKFKAIYNSYMN